MAEASGGQVLTFLLDQEVFALDIRPVREIVQYATVTPVPLMPRFVRGIVNLRGAVVPVIDLRARFGRSGAPADRRTCIVIFDTGAAGERLELGLVVDAVSEVVDLAPDALEPPPSFGTSVPRDYIRGLARLDGRFVTVLDAARALDVDEMERLCESSQLELCC